MEGCRGFAGEEISALLHGSTGSLAGGAGDRTPGTAMGRGEALAAWICSHGWLRRVGFTNAIRAISPWYWYLHENMLVRGPNIESWLPALVLSLAAAGAGVRKFLGRDLR